MRLYAAYRQKGLHPVPVGLALAPLLLLSALLLPEDRAMEAAVMLLALLAAVGVGAIVLRGQVDGARLQATLLPLIYPGVFYILLFDLTFAGEGMPLTLLFVLLFLVPSMNDCFALFTGMACGRHKLSPQISPKKTIEGCVGRAGRGGGFRRAAAQARLPALWRGRFRAQARVVLRALWPYGRSACADRRSGRVARQARLRRQDFGKIFPGHGGVMDRLDGILFATLACYVFFRMMDDGFATKDRHTGRDRFDRHAGAGYRAPLSGAAFGSSA